MLGGTVSEGSIRCQRTTRQAEQRLEPSLTRYFVAFFASLPQTASQAEIRFLTLNELVDS